MMYIGEAVNEPGPEMKAAIAHAQSLKVFKSCGCGRVYSRKLWNDLVELKPQDGGEEDGVHFFLEQRQCPCGSTLAHEWQTRDLDIASLMVRWIR